jgi:hypothetical protein
MVTPGIGMQCLVDVGRAWFNSAWIYNDAKLPLNIDQSDVLMDRIDAVVIEVDTTIAVRDSYIKIIKGTPHAIPQRPEVIQIDKFNQHVLAYIHIHAKAVTITQTDITYNVGTSDCPYVTGILQITNIDNIVAQWQAQWNNFTARHQVEIEMWIEDMKNSLDGDIATSLAAQIYKTNKVTLATLYAADWAGSSPPYTQTVLAPGANDHSEATLVSALEDGATLPIQTAYNKAFAIVTSGTASLGRNLFTFVSYDNSNNWESGEYSALDGQKVDNSNCIRMKELLKVLPTNKYKFVVSLLDGGYDAHYEIRSYDANGVFVANKGPIASGNIITTTDEEAFLGVTLLDDGAFGDAMLSLLDGSGLVPSIGYSTGSATFKVYKKPISDITVGLKGIGAEAFAQGTSILLDSDGTIITTE